MQSLEICYDGLMLKQSNRIDTVHIIGMVSMVSDEFVHLKVYYSGVSGIATAMIPF